MSLALDLLAQAEHLVKKDRKRPKQASLRRAVSAAYYALFHLLTEASAASLVSGNEPGRDELRSAVRRFYIHAEMKKVSNALANGSPPGVWKSAFGPVSSDVKSVAAAFVDLQEARHQADYDHTHAWTRREAMDLVKRASQAFDTWRRAKKSRDARAYLVALLAGHSF